ncbi:MAG: hypothetical protein JOZ73_02445 [Solirubrobacterales bacterium]|nr:hypothetical protein [Solirubrobacterales bacterium]
MWIALSLQARLDPEQKLTGALNQPVKRPVIRGSRTVSWLQLQIPRRSLLGGGVAYVRACRRLLLLAEQGAPPSAARCWWSSSSAAGADVVRP